MPHTLKHRNKVDKTRLYWCDNHENPNNKFHGFKQIHASTNIHIKHVYILVCIYVCVQIFCSTCKNMIKKEN